MKDFKYKFIGNYNISSLLLLLNKKSKKDWEYWTTKQIKYEAHNQTETIPLLVVERYGYYGETVGAETKFYLEFQVEILKIKSIIEKKYGNGDILGIEIAKLPKKSKVHEHRDSGISLVKNPRIHLVLSTNADVIFKVDGEPKNMRIGELWEINNTAIHSVENNGNTDRIHMIIDYKPLTFKVI